MCECRYRNTKLLSKQTTFQVSQQTDVRKRKKRGRYDIIHILWTDLNSFSNASEIGDQIYKGKNSHILGAAVVKR